MNNDKLTETARHREPTGLNVLGETLAEYYQRRANEAAREIERLRAALGQVAEIAHKPGGVGQIARDALRVTR